MQRKQHFYITLYFFWLCVLYVINKKSVIQLILNLYSYFSIYWLFLMPHRQTSMFYIYKCYYRVVQCILSIYVLLIYVILANFSNSCEPVRLMSVVLLLVYSNLYHQGGVISKPIKFFVISIGDDYKFSLFDFQTFFK